MSALVGALTALAVLAAMGPAGRRPPGAVEARVPSSTPDDGPGPGPGPAARTSARGRWRRALLASTAQAPSEGGILLVAQVAAALRSGAGPRAAWRQTADIPSDPGGVPDRMALQRAGVGERHAQTLVAACRLVVELGAPMAVVLDRMGEVLAQEEQAESERAAAVAGPRATARVLSWLPVGGIVLGAALGADPIGVLLGGGLGSLALAGGVVFLGAGRWWTSRLVAHAAEAGARG